MSDLKHVVCPSCDAVNRIPADKFSARPSCGKCHRPLLDDHPVTLHAGNFQKHINRSDIPVVVDFWAPWCGPCKMMAPAFEQASTALSPGVRFAKLNTEDEQVIGSNLNIRSIPTMVIFKNGREVTRQSGAMSADDIQSWVRNFI
jgi:thioredoxin 2